MRVNCRKILKITALLFAFVMAVLFVPSTAHAAQYFSVDEKDDYYSWYFNTGSFYTDVKAVSMSGSGSNATSTVKNDVLPAKAVGDRFTLDAPSRSGQYKLSVTPIVSGSNNIAVWSSSSKPPHSFTRAQHNANTSGYYTLSTRYYIKNLNTDEIYDLGDGTSSHTFMIDAPASGTLDLQLYVEPTVNGLIKWSSGSYGTKYYGINYASLNLTAIVYKPEEQAPSPSPSPAPTDPPAPTPVPGGTDVFEPGLEDVPMFVYEEGKSSSSWTTPTDYNFLFTGPACAAEKQENGTWYKDFEFVDTTISRAFGVMAMSSKETLDEEFTFLIAPFEASFKNVAGPGYVYGSQSIDFDLYLNLDGEFYYINPYETTTIIHRHKFILRDSNEFFPTFYAVCHLRGYYENSVGPAVMPQIEVTLKNFQWDVSIKPLSGITNGDQLLADLLVNLGIDLDDHLTTSEGLLEDQNQAIKDQTQQNHEDMDNLTNGYDASKGNEAADRLQTDLGALDDAEQNVFNRADGELLNFDFSNIFKFSAGLVSGLSVIVSFANGFFLASKDLTVAVSVLYCMIFISILVGLWRFFKNGG